MTWEWSHSNEAYDNAFSNLCELELEKLQDIWCEIQTYKQCIEEEGICHCEVVCPDNYYNEKYFCTHKSRVTDDRQWLCEWIWEFVSTELRECDNGGFNCWLLPFHSYSVPFDRKDEEE